MCQQQNYRSACTYAQSDQSISESLDYYLTVKLLNEQHLEFLSLNGDCTGLSESTLLKIPHCCKSHAAAHSVYIFFTKKQDNLGQELQRTLKVKEDLS